MEPSDEMRLGQKAIRKGLLTAEQLNWCLDLQSRLEKWGLAPPGVGAIAREKGWIRDRDLPVLHGGAVRGQEAVLGRQTVRARAVEKARSRARTSAVLFLLLAVVAAGAGVAIRILYPG